MVLCQYYLNNNCRFGSKCVNEHFDVRTLIKSEVEAALKGQQWPLSCFGPFKEKPCLPNFITDQSFEEIRYLCYEAKKQNFAAYAQQFSQEVMEAQNRMKALLSLSRDVVDAVVNLYNSNQDQNTSQPPQKSNPFSLGGNSGLAQAANPNSIFGNSPAQSNPFSNSGFGSTVQNSGGGIFGGATQPPAPNTASIFGQQGYAASNNAFAGQNSSIFGGGQQQPASNTFALPQLGGGQQNNQAANTFGMTGQVQANAFGTPAASVFGGQNPAPQPSIFGQQAAQMASTGLFNQVVPTQPQQQAQNLGFVLGAPQAIQPAQNADIFGGQQQQQQQQPPNIFGQPTVASNPSGFGNSMAGTTQANVFSSQPQQVQQQSIGYGVPPPNVFGASQQQQQQANANVFGGGGGQMNAFQQHNSQPFGVQSNTVSSEDYIPDSAYSKMEDLPPDVLEAFKAPEFVLGKLPAVPPPRELC